MPLDQARNSLSMHYINTFEVLALAVLKIQTFPVLTEFREHSLHPVLLALCCQVKQTG